MEFVLEEREEGFGIFKIGIGPREMGMGCIFPRNLECAFRVGNVADDIQGRSISCEYSRSRDSQEGSFGYFRRNTMRSGQLLTSLTPVNKRDGADPVTKYDESSQESQENQLPA